jgi:hypothetical protein
MVSVLGANINSHRPLKDNTLQYNAKPLHSQLYLSLHGPPQAFTIIISSGHTTDNILQSSVESLLTDFKKHETFLHRNATF